jgi:hypothetical protein
LTAGDTAVLVVAIAGLLGVVVLGLALASMARAVHSLQATIELLRQDAAARAWAPPAGTLSPGEVTADATGRGRQRRRRDAGSLLARAAGANPYLDVSDPVIKVLALASGERVPPGYRQAIPTIAIGSSAGSAAGRGPVACSAGSARPRRCLASAAGVGWL